MHRRPATLIHIVLASLPLSACSTAPNRDFPGVSQPYIAQPHLGDQSLADTHLHRKEQKSRIAKLIKPESAYTGIYPEIILVGCEPALCDRLSLALFHGLNTRGHISKKGNWRIVGAVDGNSVRWRIVDAKRATIADIDQAGTSDAAVAAVIPGVLSYLPVML